MFLLDSVLLIDFINKRPEASNFFYQLDMKKVGISAITIAEVVAGCQEDELPFLNAFINKVHYFSIDKETASMAGQLRQQYHWKLPNALQAALSMKHKLILVTRNTKDFDPKIHKFVNIPYRL